MNADAIYEIIKAAAQDLSTHNEELQPLEAQVQADSKLSDYGYDYFTFGELGRNVEERLEGWDLNLESFFVPEAFYELTMGQLVAHIEKRTGSFIRNPIVVYVDDEEENLFIFRRKFGKDFTIKSFSDPREAVAFINANPDVALVITDEVMPGIRGNELCDEVRKTKPFMKFILITGNPENDNDLMYKALRQNRFYEFFQKPVDFDSNREKYLSLIQSIISREA